MKRNHRWSPALLEGLEDRVVLSHVAAGRGLSVVVSGLAPGRQVLSRQQLSIIAEVNQAFSSFSNDYDQARSAYYASVLNQTSANPATLDAVNAFKLYTTQRVSLLSQQLISSFLQSAQSTGSAKGTPNTLKSLIATKIISPDSMNKFNGVPNGLLIQSLVNSIPSAGASPSTASLYTLSQDNAIESARVTVVNGANIIKYGDFGNSSSRNKH